MSAKHSSRATPKKHPLDDLSLTDLFKLASEIARAHTKRMRDENERYKAKVPKSVEGYDGDDVVLVNGKMYQSVSDYLKEISEADIYQSDWEWEHEQYLRDSKTEDY